MTREKRPPILPGSVQRIRTGWGKVYVGINDHDDRPFEIFIKTGDSGGYTNGWCEALAKAITHDLRSGGDMSEIASAILGIRSDKVGDDNGDQIYSIPDAVAIAMLRYELDKTGESIRNGDDKVLGVHD